MFWKVMALLMVAWGVALYFAFTLGGLIHLLPLAVVIAVGFRRMGKAPDTEFGRWRSAAERMNRPR